MTEQGSTPAAAERVGWRTYLTSLTWPDSVADAVDLVSKTVIALAIALVGWAYQDAQQRAVAKADVVRRQEDRNRRELELDRQAREDARATYGFFVTGMPESFETEGGVARLRLMTAFCNESGKARAPLAEKACSTLPTVPITAAQRLTAAAEARRDPAAFAKSDIAMKGNVAAQAREAVEAPAEGARWFAVAGTVPVEDPAAARSLAAALSTRLKAAGVVAPIAIYRTKLSRSFAITVGGPLDPSVAKAIANRVRSSGVVSDAFAQPDRDWLPAGI